VRPGGIVLLIGGTGRRKTSMGACLAVEHARDAGPAIAMSLELPADEWTARAIGSRREAAWAEVLRGGVPRDDMESALPDRLARIDRGDASVEALGQAIDDLRAEYPDQPVLCIVDYVQLATVDGDEDMRIRIGRVMKAIDALARSKRVVVLALSLGSRASSRELAAGDRVGAATTDAGAESADLERWSTVTIAIGTIGQEGEDGSSPAELSIGKSRMGRGDVVIAARSDGRTGRWWIAGEARPAADVKAERQSERDAARLATLTHAIRDVLRSSSKPLSKREIETRSGARGQDVRAAVGALLRDQESGVVECGPALRGHRKIWLADMAAEAGMDES
jgi:hypothetical protein